MELSRREAVTFAVATLKDFVDGREKSYAVKEVLTELEALFDHTANIPILLIKQSLQADEEQKAPLIDKAINLIRELTRGDND